MNNVCVCVGGGGCRWPDGETLHTKCTMLLTPISFTAPKWFTNCSSVVKRIIQIHLHSLSPSPHFLNMRASPTHLPTSCVPLCFSVMSAIILRDNSYAWNLCVCVQLCVCTPLYGGANVWWQIHVCLYCVFQCLFFLAWLWNVCLGLIWKRAL